MKTIMILKISAALLLALLWVSIPAYATGNQNHECQGGHNCNENGNGQTEATSEATATAESTATADATVYSEGGAGGAGGEGGAASASNEGVTVEGDRVENNSSNVVLVPNNNTESCLRVWGLGWGNASGSGGIGIPVRSKKCDYEQAADDAFAAGERELGWFWKCENANLYKSFKDKGESKESAKQDCLDRMLGGITAMKTITSLTEQLAFSEEERRIARQKHTESNERLTQACEESKDRILQACQK